MEAPKRTRDCEGGRTTKAHILKNFVPDFIKSYQKYNIRKFVSQKNLRSPRTLDNNLKVNFGKMIFFNMTRTRMSTLYQIPPPSNNYLMEQKYSYQSLIQV